ncbi:MAG: cytochrome c biogenesis protein CcsA [Arcobacteraceae bacterium]
MKKISNILFSYWTMAILLILLGTGAAVATFIENDYGTSTARVLVYNHLWYETVLLLTVINLLGVIYKTSMWKRPARFLFHFSFAVILLGSIITRYTGYEGIMHIREGQTQNEMVSQEPYLQVTIEHDGKSYYQEFSIEFSALGNDFTYNIEFEDKTLNLKYKEYVFAKQETSTMGLLTLDATIDNETKEYKLPGQRAQVGLSRGNQFGDTTVLIEYGSKTLTLPFSIHLRDFQLERYPGSMSPSSYASEVTVIKANKENYDYRIFMNTTLNEGNYLFFQSSYDMDELGTILSVNNDPGKWPTYFGYFLLTLGLVMNFFDKKSRFWKLTKYLKDKNIASFILASLLLSSISGYAKEYENVEEYIKEFKATSKISAEKFGSLAVQTSQGRMKPLGSLNKQILNKLSGKNDMFGMNYDQIVLGMITRPEYWRFVKMIKIKTPKLKQVIGIPESENYISFADVFKDGKYLLIDQINEANRINPNQRGTFEKDLIQVDERLNVAYLVYSGELFKIFPKFEKGNDSWYTPLMAIQEFEDDNKMAVETMTKGLINYTIVENWEMANEFIDHIAQYQKKVGAKVVPSDTQMKYELLFEKIDVFPKLTLAYVLCGFILFIVAFASVFNEKLKSKYLTYFFFTVLAILFAVHTFGMGLRWYVSGHAPWSDTYESLLYISWSAIFAGVVFFRKSLLALSGSVIVAGIFMFTAHLSHIDPQITNLVPVLKSYWLTIHVSILTGSYGFLGLGAILGFMAMLLFIFRSPKRKHIDETIKHITTINEVSLIIGLAALTIGNFLGGVWANESWGRYWGWDPKETWAYVAIVTYIFVLHLRLIKGFNTAFVFSVASLLAFSTILMTYFGVNFYLSGMHSYATGDPLPIPTWVYVLTVLVFVTIVIAYRKRDLKDGEICTISKNTEL